MEARETDWRRRIWERVVRNMHKWDTERHSTSRKKIAVRRNNTRDMVYVRELEAIMKFSHPKVRPLLVRFFGLKSHS